MLDDDFMWPLVQQARMGLVVPRLARAGWSEYKGDVLVADIRRDKGLDEQEAEEELRAWVASHGGDVRLETHHLPRAPGAKFPTAGSVATELIVLLPDAAVPAE
jgi:hypothetical protein